MSTATQVFGSSNDRAVGLRMRPDLTIVRHVYRNEPFWLIKDPLEMEFYRLNEEEYAVLSLIDGRASLEDIKQRFERQFAPQRITHRQLQSFIADLRKKSLLAFSSSDVGPQLIERQKEKETEKLKKKFGSILSLQWRGVDPDRFLDFITPKVGWLFSGPAVLCSVMFMLAAAGWLAAHYDLFLARLPGLASFLGQQNWLLMAFAILVMKILHELGHAISFKRFGGECHEIGVMLLMGIIPTLYCSTTDSWLLKNKWQRAAIGAAGMYVELLIAAFATFFWWFSQPGTLNMICLNIMVSGTISVLLLNGNPFFKFDGYYIFSDILELPNLQERSGKQTQAFFLRYGLGIEEPDEVNSRLGTKVTLVAYKVMVFAFRALIFASINLMLIGRLNTVGLGYIGLAIGLTGLASLVGPPAISLYKFFEVPGRLQRIEMKNSVLFFGGVALFTGFVFVIPLPHYVNCPFTLEPHDGQAIYVKHDAVLRKLHIVPGQQVHAGQLIAELENIEDQVSLTRLRSEGDEYAAELELLETSRESSHKLSSRISELRESLATNRAREKELQEIVNSFHVIATRDGSVIPHWIAEKSEHGLELSTFDGSPLSDQNLGSWMTSGQQLCSIGDLSMFDAVLAVNEHDVSFVVPGQETTLMIDSMPGLRITQSLASVANKETERLPGSLSSSNGGSIQLQTATRSGEAPSQPNDAHFEARVSIGQLDQNLSSGLRGQARIHVGSKTLFQRLMMATYRNFRKKLN